MYRPVTTYQNPDFDFLPPSWILPTIPLMEQQGVSEVARSKRGFLHRYLTVGGEVDLLGFDDKGVEWVRRRENFIKRHMAQVQNRGERLWHDGRPTRRHLALVAWAYTPNVALWRAWLTAPQ